MTVVCLILSRFYPRIFASAEVQVPTMARAAIPTYLQLVRTNPILSAVLTRHPEFTEIAGVETETWIRTRLDVNHVEKDILEIRMSGRPNERERLQELVDAIAREYVSFLTELTYDTSDEALATLQGAYEELRIQEAQTTSLPQESIEEPVGISKHGDAESIRRQQMMQKIASKIQRLKEMQKQTPAPPKVIRSSSGVDW